jgi:hypothetical protein
VNPPGHLAAAYFLARRARESRLRALAATSAGALLPDLVDKPAMWIGLTPHGRSVGHSLLFWGCALVLAFAAVRRRASIAALVVLGAFSHLVADLADDLAEGFERSGHAFSAWMGWPVTNPDMGYVAVPHLLGAAPHAPTTLELATVAACLWHLLLHRD